MFSRNILICEDAEPYGQADSTVFLPTYPHKLGLHGYFPVSIFATRFFNPEAVWGTNEAKDSRNVSKSD
jgi:hypothetical protein